VGAALTLLVGAVTAVSLLQGAPLRRAEGVQFEQRIRDGVLAADGDEWNGDTAALLETNGVVEWDLGSPQPIVGALIQGDNNDDYILAGSLDGNSWFPLWRAPTHPDPGLRTRAAVFDSTQTARYLKLTAEGGDNFYSVSELQVFSNLDEAKATTSKVTAQTTRASNPEGCNPTWAVLVAFGGIFVYFFVIRRRETAAPAEEKKEPVEPK